MGERKLTKAQKEALTIAQRSGGVIGLGPHAATVASLQNRGFLAIQRGKHGYFPITDAGRAALEAINGRS
jgi:hypothetical protein